VDSCAEHSITIVGAKKQARAAGPPPLASCPAVGMLTDIRKNPDNKLSGYIRIINYPFNYPSTWRLIAGFPLFHWKKIHYFSRTFQDHREKFSRTFEPMNA